MAQTGSLYDQRDVILTEVQSVTRTDNPAAKRIVGDGVRGPVEVFHLPESLLGAVPLEGEA